MGKFDPITREPLRESQLVPNLAIKEAVRAYMDKHGWAYKASWNFNCRIGAIIAELWYELLVAFANDRFAASIYIHHDFSYI